MGAAVLERLNPVGVLTAGFDSVQRQHVIGSTTACIVSCLPYNPTGGLQPEGGGGGGGGGAEHGGDDGGDTCIVQVANLGDSGMMLLRNGAVLVRTIEQTHAFNFPRQLGTGSQDTPADADRTSLSARAGDLVVVGTDGLFDNMYDEEIIAFVLGALSVVSCVVVCCCCCGCGCGCGCGCCAGVGGGSRATDLLASRRFLVVFRGCL
jgi:serine/threonine protein phosphatase PrpC